MRWQGHKILIEKMEDARGARNKGLMIHGEPRRGYRGLRKNITTQKLKRSI